MQKIYLFNNTSRLAVGSTQLPVQWLPGFCRGCKTAGSEVNNSSPSSADVKHKWSYTSLLPYAFMASTATALPFAITMSHFYNIILKISFHIRIFYIFGFGYSLEAFQLQLTTFMLFPFACYNYVHFMLHVSVVQITRGRLVLYSFLNDFLLWPKSSSAHLCSNAGFNYANQRSVRWINPLTPNDQYSGRTAPLTSKRWHLIYLFNKYRY